MRRTATLVWVLTLATGATGCFADRSGLGGADGGGQPPGDAGPCPGTPEACNGRDDDCDARVDETFDLSSDAAHCGACGNACPDDPAHAAAACVAGRCALTCDPGFADCDADPANGCEARLDAPTSCGSCGTTCEGATPVCAGEPPSCLAGCPDGTTECGGSCVDLERDPSHCGACDAACPAPANAAATCVDSTCGFACDADFGDCDDDPANGCEADLRTDPDHCGTCTNACPSEGDGAATCVDGSCGTACGAGRADCDGDAENGCEVDLRTDPDHCGTCTNTCPAPPNATATCAARTCGFTCDAGFEDCDGDPANGCEADLAAPESCGGCGNECAAWASCDGTACVSGCDPADNCGRCRGGCCEVGSCSGDCGTSLAGGGPCIRSYDCRDSTACSVDCSDTANCRTDCRRGGDCTLQCSGGSRCRLDCEEATQCTAQCDNDSSCVIDCAGATACDAQCDNGSPCAIDCAGADRCEVQCGNGSACLLDCNGARSCSFTGCSGGSGMASCAGGVIVCNRACP